MKACILTIHNCQNLKTKYPLTSESTKCDVFTTQNTIQQCKGMKYSCIKNVKSVYGDILKASCKD